MARYRQVLEDALEVPVIDPTQAATAAAIFSIRLGYNSRLRGGQTLVEIENAQNVIQLIAIFTALSHRPENLQPGGPSAGSTSKPFCLGGKASLAQALDEALEVLVTVHGEALLNTRDREGRFHPVKFRQSHLRLLLLAGQGQADYKVDMRR